MNIINASDYGIEPGGDITEKLPRLFEAVKNDGGEKTLAFISGEYFINAEKCERRMLYITNTAADREFSRKETPHLNAAAFYLSGVDNLILDGNNSVFNISGKATNMAFEDCNNITVKNIELRHLHPDMHELKIVNKGRFFVDFKPDGDSICQIKRGRLYFKGADYRTAANKNARTAHWIGIIKAHTPDRVIRTGHPLRGALQVKALKNGLLRARFFNTSKFEKEDSYYIFGARRQFAGIFVNRCSNIVFDNIKQRFNYSLALVLQDGENISLINSEFSPGEGSPRKLASVADFIQICMCRGEILIDGNAFEGAGDDCLNVHGVHFKITDKRDNIITVRFMHPQTHGFNPLRKGDTVAFINPETLLENGRAQIVNSKSINEYETELTLDSAENAVKREFIEDISACPDLVFSNNTVKRIITRGLLLTTRGKVKVHNNRFISTAMSGILLSDDAKSWYESGMCLNVEIKNNTFEYCGETPILIMPENKKHISAVHKNIKIIGNTFKSYEGFCIRAKSADGIELDGNTFNSDKIISCADCGGINIKNNLF